MVEAKALISLLPLCEMVIGLALTIKIFEGVAVAIGVTVGAVVGVASTLFTQSLILSLASPERAVTSEHPSNRWENVMLASDDPFETVPVVGVIVPLVVLQ